MRLYDTEEKKEQFVLVGVDTGRFDISMEESLNELEELLETDGGEAVGRVIQNLQNPSSRTYVGSGKVEEIRQILQDTGADGIICDDELSPAQLKNLSDELGVKVIDRTLLILDIFTKRATTREGQMQIELAQLNYRLTRLTGLGKELSRQGAAVGTHTRGAGETKLEMDRRHIRERIDMLKSQLKEVAERRDMERTQRKKGYLPIIALVGYTNAGKSTVFNRVTGASVLEEDQLFATLDTTVRRKDLPSGRSVLFTDTVGFIHKLPHQLIDAFRATLEEACEADILLHVVDSSDPKAQMQMKVTYDTLVELKAADKPIITVLNKQDLVQEEAQTTGPSYHAEEILRISALEEEGIRKVLEAVDRLLDQWDQEMLLMIPYAQAGLTEPIHQEAVILSEDYTEQGIRIRARIKEPLLGKVKKFQIEDEV